MKDFARLLTMLGIVVFLTACGSSVSKDNFDKISNGMTVAEVEAILGKPTSTSAGSGTVGNLTGSGQVSTWTSGNKKIVITYANGKVALKTAENL